MTPPQRSPHSHLHTQCPLLPSGVHSFCKSLHPTPSCPFQGNSPKEVQIGDAKGMETPRLRHHQRPSCVLSHSAFVLLFVIPWPVAHQAPLSMGFSRQEYWSGLPFPPLGDLPDPGIEPMSPALQVDSFFFFNFNWRKHKLESRVPGEISITSDMQMTPPLWQKVKRN